MEPWDGPANISFTDGTVIGSVLDRNGLRPGRYWVTDDGVVILGSEAGVLPVAPETVLKKGRLQPGRMFLVDTEQGRIVPDADIKSELANARGHQGQAEDRQSARKLMQEGSRSVRLVARHLTRRRLIRLD